MNSQFKMVASESEHTLIVRGMIDERSDFSTIDLRDVKVLVLDLSQVGGLNSMGLRNWVLWSKSVPASTAVRIRNCPRVVVDQLNILQGFMPSGARVESFFVPYRCDGCGLEESVLATRGKDFMEGTVDAKEGVSLPETKPCPACGAQLEMDFIPAKYFAFLKYRRL